MKSALIAVIWLVFGWSGQTQAQEPSGRIDLDAPFGSIITIRVGFVESERDCPYSRQTLRISNATLMQVNPAFADDPQPRTQSWQATEQPSDDETQLYRIATPTCRTEIAVREQVRRDGAWILLLVPKMVRPSVPSEERRELWRQSMESALSRRRIVDATGVLRSAGSLSPIGFAGPTVFFSFEDKPDSCFEAIGDYLIQRTGVTFSFFTGLPGDLNRFVIERIEPDPNRARLFFTRGDCRFELTIGQSVLQNDEWLAVPLAPTPATKG